MKKNFFLSGLGLLCLVNVSAQNNVGIGTTTPHSSAVLEVKSTTQGVLVPRLTQTERNAIASPADGLLIYQTDNTKGLYIYNSTTSSWSAVSDGSSQLEKITENGKTGYRLSGWNANNFGEIGLYAMDLTTSTQASPTIGATGEGSFAVGIESTASAEGAMAIGYAPTASGLYSVAIGETSIARAKGEVALGWNEDYTPVGNNITTSTKDRAFTVGIEGKDVFKIYKSKSTLLTNNTSGNPADGDANLLGTGTASAQSLLQLNATGAGINIANPNNKNAITLQKPSKTINTVYMSFGYLSSGAYAEIGSIKSNGSDGGAILYNTTSDRRLKNDLGLFKQGLATINQLKIHNYSWKSSQAKEIGVFAQELHQTYPNAVSKGDDEPTTDPAQIKTVWQVDYSKLVPVLVAATQELSTKNEQLEKENAALKQQLANFNARLAKLEKSLEAAETNTATANKQ